MAAAAAKGLRAAPCGCGSVRVRVRSALPVTPLPSPTGGPAARVGRGAARPVRPAGAAAVGRGRRRRSSGALGRRPCLVSRHGGLGRQFASWQGRPRRARPRPSCGRGAGRGVGAVAGGAGYAAGAAAAGAGVEHGAAAAGAAAAPGAQQTPQDTPGPFASVLLSFFLFHPLPHLQVRSTPWRGGQRGARRRVYPVRPLIYCPARRWTFGTWPRRRACGGPRGRPGRWR